MQTQKFGVDAFDALFSKSIEFQKYVTNIETAVKINITPQFGVSGTQLLVLMTMAMQLRL